MQDHQLLQQDSYQSAKSQRLSIVPNTSPSAPGTVIFDGTSTEVILEIHVSLVAGYVDHIFLGVPGMRMDYIVYGKCMEELGSILDGTKRGELGLSDSFFALFNESVVRAMKVFASRSPNQSFWLFRGRESFTGFKEFLENTTPSQEVSSLSVDNDNNEDDLLLEIDANERDRLKAIEKETYSVLRTFVNESLVNKLETHAMQALSPSSLIGRPSLSRKVSVSRKVSTVNSNSSNPYSVIQRGEFRTISILFVKLPSPFEASKAQRVFSSFVQCVRRFEGSVQQFAVDDKGATILGCFGLPPWTHEKDSLYALHAATEFEEEAKSILGAHTKLSVSVATGELLFSVLGGKGGRWEASLLGDTVNIAARLLGIHDTQGAIKCDKETFKATREDFTHVPLGLQKLKGYNDGVEVYIVKPKSNVLASTTNYDKTDGSTLKELGYKKERAIMNEAIELFLRSPVSAVDTPPSSRIVVMGKSGCGKSNLLASLTRKLSASGVGFSLTQATEIKQYTPYFALQGLMGRLMEHYLDLNPTVREGLDAGGSVTILKQQREEDLGSEKSRRSSTLLGKSRSRSIFHQSRSTLVGTKREEAGANGPNHRILVQFLLEMGENPALAPLLSDLVPLLSVGDSSYTKSMDGATRKALVKSMVVRIVKRFISKEKFVILFDDAQWIDAISLEIIDMILYKCPEAMVYIFMRPLGEKPLPIFGHIFEAPGLQTISINGLTVDDVEDILIWKFENFGVKSVLRAVSSAIFERCEGSPLNLDALAESAKSQFWDIFKLDELGTLMFNDEEAEQKLEKMSTLKSSILIQFDKQNLLRAAAIFGQYFNLEDVCAISEEFTQASHLVPLIESSDTYQFLIKQDPDDPYSTQYYFRHIQIQLCLYDSLPYSHLLECHQLCAEYFESMLTDANRDMLIPVVAYHYKRTDATDAIDKQIKYLAEMGMSNYERSYFRESVNALESLTEILNTAGPKVSVEPLTKAQWIAALAAQRVTLLNFTKEAVLDLCFEALGLLGEPWPGNDAKVVKKMLLRGAFKLWRMWKKTNGGLREASASRSFWGVKTPKLSLEAALLKQRTSLLCYLAIFRLSHYSTLVPIEWIPLIFVNQCLSCISMALVDKVSWASVLYIVSYGFSYSLAPISKAFFNKSLEVEKTTSETEQEQIHRYYQYKGLQLLNSGRQKEAIEALQSYVKYHESRGDISQASVGYFGLYIANIFLGIDIHAFDAPITSLSKEKVMYQLPLVQCLVCQQIYAGNITSARETFVQVEELVTKVSKVPMDKAMIYAFLAWFAFHEGRFSDFVDAFEETATLLSPLRKPYMITFSSLLGTTIMSLFAAIGINTEGMRCTLTAADKVRILKSLEMLRGIFQFLVKVKMHAFDWLLVHNNAVKLLIEGHPAKAASYIQNELGKKRMALLLDEMAFLKGLIFSTLGLIAANDVDRGRYVKEAMALYGGAGFKYLEFWMTQACKR
ncbi:hypothetical protein HDV05_006049 [Chytridiales sp. JEL 0842]|nr:hypothetical protein HDV05_006049 [Chytridiales sp. JEL 0842]